MTDDKTVDTTKTRKTAARKQNYKKSSSRQKSINKDNRFAVLYNAPVSLTFCIICIIVMFINYRSTSGMLKLFIGPGRQGSDFAFNMTSFTDYLRLFTHVAGSLDWSHLLTNLTFILLLGPILEEQYGSRLFLLMFTICAFVSGVINACFVPYGITGATSIVFMSIILISFSTVKRKKIPLTFILLVLLYVFREFFIKDNLSAENISTASQFAGGLAGSIFGLTVLKR